MIFVKDYFIHYETPAFLESEEKELYIGRLSEKEQLILEYLSKTVLSGARPYELEILKRFMKQKVISMDEMIDAFEKKGYLVDNS